MLPSRGTRSALSTDHHAWLRSVSGPWILALITSKAGDLLTTVVGLTVVDGLSERNPVAGAVFLQFGVVGLLVMTAAVLLGVVLVVERAAIVLERHDDSAVGSTTVYLIGYLPLVAVFGAATVYNAVLLCIHA